MRTLILSLVVLAVPAAASAQVCPAGLVAVDGAHCCWPGQAFAPERGVCSGAPQCPPGLAAFGETCAVGSAPAPQPQLPPQPDLPPQPVPEPQEEQALPPPPPPPPPGVYQGYQVPAKSAPVQGPQVYGTVVRFEAKTLEHQFTVTMDDGQSCRTPCGLSVQPGKHKVKVAGEASFTQRVDIPASPSVVQIEKRRSGGTALAVVSLAVGIPTALVGGFVGLIGLASNTSYATSGNRNAMYTGFGVMAVGVTLAAAGGAVGFHLAGHNRLAFAQGDASQPKAAPVQLLSLGLAPTSGGAMAGATFAF